MAERRSKIINKQVGPWAMPGTVFIADSALLSDGKTLTVKFPAKSIIAVIASSYDDTDAKKVVSSSSIDDEVGTVTFTKTGNGAFSYLIIATEVEDVATQTITTNTTQTPVA